VSIIAREAFTKSSTEDSSRMLGCGQRWYAVRTLPFSETRAQRNLENQSFRTFLPKRRKTVRHARKITTVGAPLFPCYMFVALDLTFHQWRSVNGTFGVSRLLMQGDRPLPVPEGVVETLIASADDAGVVQFGQQLRVGMPVRVMAGPFVEQLAILDRLDDCGRVRVLLELMGRQVPASLHCNDLLPLA